MQLSTQNSNHPITHQMTLFEYLERMATKDKRHFCRGHKRYDCPYHCGRRGYRQLGQRILAAMREAARERESMGNRIDPMFPHDVWVYMEGELPHIQTMRKYMKELASRLEIIKIGARGGYVLPEYVHVVKSGHGMGNSRANASHDGLF